MKNNKNLKTIFTGVVIVLSLTLLVLTTYWGDVSKLLMGGGFPSTKTLEVIFLWSQNDAGDFVINWKLAGIFLAFLIVAIGFATTKMAMFTIPNKDKTALVFDIIALVGLVMIIVGLFIPLDLNNVTDMDGEKATTIFRVAQVTLYAGSPIALVAMGVNGVIGLKAGK